jgi:hypothetical protein
LILSTGTSACWYCKRAIGTNKLPVFQNEELRMPSFASTLRWFISIVHDGKLRLIFQKDHNSMLNSSPSNRNPVYSLSHQFHSILRCTSKCRILETSPLMVYSKNRSNASHNRLKQQNGTTAQVAMKCVFLWCMQHLLSAKRF